MTAASRRRATLVASLCALATLVACAAAVAAARVSLPTIERQVMCVTCKIPLNVAESPQSDRERAFIAGLIERGADEAQIKHALVGQYGSSVLALPSDNGFDSAAYIVPLAACAALIATLALLLPRWRRRARERGGAEAPAPALGGADARRLQADMDRLD